MSTPQDLPAWADDMITEVDVDYVQQADTVKMTPVPEQPLTPTGPLCVGPYRLCARIGTGHSAIVYRATNKIGMTFALKVIDLHYSDDAAARYEREVSIIRDMEPHPNIVPVDDVGIDGHWCYIAMPLMNGGTMKQRIDEHGHKPFPTGLACAWIIQMCHALDYFHRESIVHRDIKPANMLSNRKEPDWWLLTDFGIARLLDAPGITESGKLWGTPEYMAPEVARGQDADGRSDVYSLACVLYELVCGYPPFHGGNPIAIASKHVHDMPIAADTINPALTMGFSLIIDKALMKQPGLRYKTAREFGASLDVFATHL